MQDMKAHLEKLRADAAECALIRDLATDPQKRALFTRLADHLSTACERGRGGDWRQAHRRDVRPPIGGLDMVKLLQSWS